MFTMFYVPKIEVCVAMPSPAQNPTPRGGHVLPPISSSDSVRYTRDLLETLREIAIRQGHMVLARLLEAAAGEADRLVQT